MSREERNNCFLNTTNPKILSPVVKTGMALFLFAIFTQFFNSLRIDLKSSLCRKYLVQWNWELSFEFSSQKDYRSYLTQTISSFHN